MIECYYADVDNFAVDEVVQLAFPEKEGACVPCKSQHSEDFILVDPRCLFETR